MTNDRTVRSSRVPISSVALATVARRLVESTLGLEAGQHLLIVHDETHLVVAEAIVAAAARITSNASLLSLTSLARRPHARLLPDVRRRLMDADATVLLIDRIREEGRMRVDFVEATMAKGIKHAHIVGVSRDALLAGLSTEPSRIASLARALRRRLSPVSKIRVRSRLGTDLTVKCSPTLPWIEMSGAIRPGEWENVPSGELVTHQPDVDGVYVADGTLGDDAGEFAALLRDDPLRFRVERGRVVSVEAKNTLRALKLRKRFSEMKNLDRVGHIVLGTNLGIGDPTGSISIDQKAPGLHLSFGQTFRARTGAAWDVPAWISVTATALDIDVDATPIVRGGHYLFTA